VHGAISDKHDVPAAAAVAAVWSSARDELLAVKADEPVSTIAATDVYLSLIYQSCKPL
jgi:hypothetical protein